MLKADDKERVVLSMLPPGGRLVGDKYLTALNALVSINFMCSGQKQNQLSNTMHGKGSTCNEEHYYRETKCTLHDTSIL